MKKISFPILVLGVFLVSCSHKPTPSSPAERLAWHENTLTKAYETIGRKDAKWDESAKSALAEFVKVRAGQEDDASGVVSAGALAQQAVQAGCDDPLVRYLYCRWAPNHSSKPTKFWQDEYRKMAEDMESSGYAPLLKFYANACTANLLWENRDETLWPDVSQFRRAAMKDIDETLADKSLPIQDVASSCDAFMDTIDMNPQETADAYPRIMAIVSKNWPGTPELYYLKGKIYYRFAWNARGGGYADKVTTEGWEGFKENLALADKAYRKAWSLNPKDPRIPTQMIEMAVSQEKDRPEMELWFQRAMELNPNNHVACVNKLRYLMPRWYGSFDDMVAFGRECLESPKWGGRIPLMLPDMYYDHAQELDENDREAFWHEPQIWPDIQASYKKFLEVNPNPLGMYRYDYAYYAYHCGQWKEFKLQIKAIRDADGTVNVKNFGGEEAFTKMVEQANAKDGTD